MNQTIVQPSVLLSTVTDISVSSPAGEMLHGAMGFYN